MTTISVVEMTPEQYAEYVMTQYDLYDGYPGIARDIANGIRQAVARERQQRAERPTIVCLCGSTRFYATFQEANYRETMAGNIVLSVGFYPHSSEQAHGETIGITPEQKEALDQLHLRKVAMADEVLILNLHGYIGESTARELAHARALGKVVRFLEDV